MTTIVNDANLGGRTWTAGELLDRLGDQCGRDSCQRRHEPGTGQCRPPALRRLASCRSRTAPLPTRSSSRPQTTPVRHGPDRTRPPTERAGDRTLPARPRGPSRARSPRFHASTAASAISTFSCDIGRAVSRDESPPKRALVGSSNGTAPRPPRGRTPKGGSGRGPRIQLPGRHFPNLRGRGGCRNPNTQLTNQPFSRDQLQRRADRAWRAAGLKRINPHECRHTYASLMIAAGVNEAVPR